MSNMTEYTNLDDTWKIVLESLNSKSYINGKIKDNFPG